MAAQEVMGDVLRELLAQVLVWPRRLLLRTPGLEATVPMLRGVWGAALHDRATGIHRPLSATALWLAPADGGADPLLALGLDLCLLDPRLYAGVDQVR